MGLTNQVARGNYNLAESGESEIRFQTIFEDAAIGIGIMGLDRCLIDVNRALCRMYGMTRDELIGKGPDLVTFPEDYPRSTADFQEFLSGNDDYYETERRYQRKDGEVFWAHVSMSLVRDLDSNPLYIIGIVIDINDRVQTVERLRQSEERFRAIFDNTTIGVTLSTLDRHVVQLNEALTRITGYSLEDLKDLHPSDLAHPEDRQRGQAEFQELLAGTREEFTLERRYYHKSGRLFWGRVTYSLIRDENGNPVNLVGLMEDITEQKSVREQLAAAEAEYRQTLEQKVAERTQELQLTNIQLQEEILQRQIAEQTLAEKAAQEAITTERNRLARELHDAVTQTLFSASLIAEVLPDIWKTDPGEGMTRLEELSQMTRGALAEMRTLLIELRPNSLIQIPLADLIRQLCESMLGRARLPIHFNVEGERKIPPDVQIALYRITQEALNNILKHAKATKVVVSLLLGDSVRLMIVDDGCGFDPSRVSPDHLGLKIICERGESIGARCSIYSRIGEGTQITVLWQDPDHQTKAGSND